jgi:thiol:disulfide interchange protein DsbD
MKWPARNLVPPAGSFRGGAEGSNVNRWWIVRALSAVLSMALAALLAGSFTSALAAEEEFLQPERAFQFSARALDPRSVEVIFDVAPGYYMYREAFRVVADKASLGTPQIPKGEVKYDENFQKDVETYRETVRIRVPVEQAGQTFRLEVTSQGCADKGLCYPPMQSAAEVSLAGFGGDGSIRVVPAGEPPGVAAGEPFGAAGDGKTSAAAGGLVLDGVLRSGRFWAVIGAFFLAGTLLSLTPCVLPMLPILSSIIVGHGTAVTRRRGLALAASYSLGMALVYTALGVAAGLAGEGLAAALQNAWVLGAFALLLAVLSLSMFGVYELRMPAALTERLDRGSRRLGGGRVGAVFAMGGVSALIVSPCVAAPLAGALVYLSQTRDVVLGGSALFALAAGMSVPLLLLGASAGSLLPRAGAWMEGVKRFFGLLLLAVALWTVQPVLPGAFVLLLWGALLLAAALLLRPFGEAGPGGAWGRRALASVLAVLGLIQIVGAASGGRDPLQPLAHLTGDGAASGDASPVRFQKVRSVAELDAALRQAGRPVMLDFYADWCVSCKEMERFTFSDPDVKAKLDKALLLKADVTANTPADRELLRRFTLFGPPGTIFFDAQGRELKEVRVIGFQNRDEFLQTLAAAGL